MVPIRRHSLHPRSFGYGDGDGTGSWLSILWTCAAEVGSEHDMGLHGLIFGYHIPMVLLGLLARFQQLRNERIHRRFGEVWSSEYTGSAQPW